MQIVVYSGNHQWTAPTAIHRRGLQFEFEVVDIRVLSSRRLLTSGDSGDTLIAIPCAGGTDRDVKQAIVNKIRQAAKSEQADLGAQLLVLAQVRGVRALVEREIKAMPITVNIEDIALLREPLERARAKSLEEGMAKGRAAAIERLLLRKFPADVPAGLAEHWAKLPPGALTRSSTIA